jgi:hypothetical protein
MVKHDSKAGGGFGSRQHVEAYSPKQEPRSRSVNPGGAAQIGSAIGNHVMDKGTLKKNPAVPLYGGPGYAAKGPTPTVPGPGGGRETRPHSTQGMHGAAAQGSPQAGHGRGIDQRGRTTK